MSRWPLVTLDEVLTQDKSYTDILEPRYYPKLSVKLYGKGVVLDSPANGAEVKMTKHQLAKSGQVILSEIWGKKGAIGIVPEKGTGALCTSHFFLFDVDESKVNRSYLGWLLFGNYLESQLDAKAKGTTGYAAVRPNHFLAATIPLPTLEEQRAIAARLDAVADKAWQVEAKLNAIEADAEQLLTIRFRETIEGADWRPMAEVAPLVRREVEVDLEGSYPELGIRSFGKGTFHKPALSGADVGSKRLFRIEPSDLIFSNVFAWEGAIAVVKAEDSGRCGSHRFITCVTDTEKASPEFLRYYFLTPEGLEKIGEASPGGAGRNRTLGIEKLMALQVPVPKLDKQQTFDKLQSAVAEMKAKHAEIRQELKALLPSMLEQIF